MAKSDVDDQKKVSRKDLFLAWIKWGMFIEACPSWERLQALGFLHSIWHILDKLYTDTQERIEAYKRHLVFYNSQGVWGGMIGGITIAMEEQRANGAEISDEAINGIKTGLMGPLAGIGDTVDWGTIVPLGVSLGLPLASQGSPLGGILSFLIPSIIITAESYYFFFKGYSAGRQSIQALLRSGAIGSLLTVASIVGMCVMGAIAGQYVNLTTPIAIPTVGGEVLELQSGVLDSIVKGMLPLILVLGCYYLLSWRRMSTSKVIAIIMSVGLIGGLLYLF